MIKSFFSRNFSFKHWLAFFALVSVFLFFKVGNADAKLIKFLTNTGTVYVSGNLGIGTSNPTAPLHIGVGGIKFPNSSVITSAATSSVQSLASAFDIFLNADSDGNGSGSLIAQTKGVAKMFLNNLGNVGIGTSTPLALLHVFSNVVSSPGGPYNFTTTGTGSTGTIQTWTVPVTGTYTIDAYGAQGGAGTSYTGGLGARTKGDVYLTAGTQIKILVGQQGGDNTTYKAGGGGGGTFVTTNTNTPLIVAGGGGGGGGNSNAANGQSGLTTNNGGTGSQGVYAGGTGGLGGGANAGTAGGAGLTGNGGSTSCTYVTSVPLSFVNGGTGGGGGTCSSEGAGGFGGGSGGEWCCQGAAGAGGGYSGGGGTDGNGVAGGGGSYNSGTNQTNTAGVKSGAGSVTITWATGASAPAAIFNGNVGIGATTSIVPLSFGSTYNLAKINLFDNGTIASGFGSYFPDTLRIFGDNTNKEITFGSQTRAGAFSESMRIDTGRVGIGITNPLGIFHSGGVVASPGGPYNFTTTGTGSTGTIQTWTVPVTGTYTIDAYGAQGGAGTSYTGGLGARTKGDVYLTAGTQIKILVGQQGGSNASYNAGGGGGGTFITTNTNTPLIVAGGGGGGGGNTTPANGQSGLTTNNGGTGSQGVYAGGTGGSGGGANAGTAGGAGLTGNGGSTSCTSITSAPLSFVNGGTGGAGGSCGAGGGAGGFGGGSGGEWCCQGAAGAGGGYSGGGGTDNNGVAGGGGSYNSGTNQTNTAGAKTGAGSATITWVSGGGGGNNIFEGNFGINQSSPAFKFDASGNGRFTLPVTVGTPTGDTHATTKSYLESVLVGGEGITIGKWIKRGVNVNSTNLGNIGIGTTNPLGLLHSLAKVIVSPGGPYPFDPTSQTGSTGTIQTWTVPKSGVYTIEAYGAEGGGSTSYATLGGKGARIKGDVYLIAGEVIKVMVGQKGGDAVYDGMGGGGTFVVKQSGNTPIIIAGGGGGASGSGANAVGMDAVTGTTSTADRCNSCAGVSGPSGGTACSNASGGGGFTGNGGAGSGSFGGVSYTNGGTGGNSYYTVTGGFGGGGGSHGGGWGGGGGGGYGGGSAHTAGCGGGGGSSYNSGAVQSNTAGVRTGAGIVTITWNGGSSAVVFEGNVGIGITNPLSLFHLNTTSGNTIETLSSTGATSAFSRYINLGAGGWIFGRNGTTSAFQISYANNDTPSFGINDFFTILNSGNVGIGSTNPVGLLQAKASLLAPQTLTYNGSSGNGNCTIQSWTVPVTGVITIDTYGGAGSYGENGSSGSAGARTKGDFLLTAGQVLYFLVGGGGDHGSISSGTDGTSGGSGGASTVAVVNPAGAYTMTDSAHNGTKVDILISAAGGGGGNDALYQGSSTNGAPGYGNSANTVYTSSIANSFLNGGLGSYYSRSDGYSQGGCGGGIGTDDSATTGGGFSYNGMSSYSYNTGTNQLTSDATSGAGKITFTYQPIGASGIFEGNVGIGTTSPAFKLDVYGTGRFGSALIVGTPTANNHATTKSYVDSRPSTARWTISSNNIYSNNTGNVGFGNVAPLAKLSLGGGLILNRTPVNDTAYTALDSDYIIAYTALTASRVVTLPSTLCTAAKAGKILDIVDESGNANTGKTITIDPEGATTIIGQATFSLGAPYNSVMIYCNGTNWRMN